MTVTIRALLVTFFLAMATAGVSAQTKPDCANAKTQLELNACSLQQYKAADKELNAIYVKVRARLTSAQKTALTKAQRSWITFRDQHAAVYGLLYKGGSMAAMAVNNCKTELTETRTAELKRMLGELER